MNTSLLPFAGSWDQHLAAHLLRRTTFGATKSDVSTVLSLGMDAAVTMLLAEPTIQPGLPVNNYYEERPDPNITPGQTFLNAAYSQDHEAWRIKSLKTWWLRQMLDQPINIGQKLIFFWHNHVPVSFNGVFSARKDWNYLEVLRNYAFGSFKDMMRAMTLDPAMLTYLNGQSNTSMAPDENYGRELQELFCIGKGPDSHYTEDDVKAAAKVLTGWRVNVNYTGYMVEAEHDTGNKEFSAFYNHTVIQGNSGPSGGATELEDLLNMLFDHPECALFICRKLYHFFVSRDITPQIESDIIGPMADILRTNNHEIIPVLDVLLRSEHFYEAATQGSIVKSPLDFGIGLIRETGVVFPDYHNDLAEYYHLSNLILDFMARNLLSLGEPPNVAGYPAWYQQPAYDKLWINTDTYPKRLQLLDNLLNGAFSYQGFDLKIDLLALAGSFDNPSDPQAFAQEAIERFLTLDISNGRTQTALVGILLSGQTNPQYWTDAWQNYIASPGNTTLSNIVEARLRLFFSALFQRHEYYIH